MAEALVKFFLYRMKYSLIQEAEILAGMGEELDRLMTILQEVGSFFQKLGSVEWDPAVCSWVNEFRDLIFDAENLIDEFVIQMKGEEGSPQKGLQDQFRSELQKFESSLAEKLITMASIHGSSAGESSVSSEIKSVFNNLPYYLRASLMYCVMFPENCLIPKDRLVRLLVAEGLIQDEMDKIMEDVAENNIDELLRLGILQRDDEQSGNGTELRVEPLFHEYLLCNMMGENSSPVSGVPFSVCGFSIRTDMSNLVSRLSNLRPRSLLMFGNPKPSEEKVDWLCFQGARFLRVLDLEDTGMKRLPDEVGDLVHLRYLGLKGTNISELPRKLGNLRTLQTLDIRWCGYVIGIPDEILYLSRLRHLEMFKNIGVSGVKLPMGIHRLKDLLTLTGVLAGEDTARELGSMIQLRTLGVMDVSPENSDQLCASVMKMQGLLCLSLKTKKANFNRDRSALTLSETFCPPPLIMKLQLEGFLERMPNWIRLMANLTKLRLGYSHLYENPSLVLQLLPKLKNLTLWHAYEARQMGKEFCDAGGFPELEVLVIASHVLEEWTEIEQGAFPNLKYLHFHNCLKLRMLPEGLQFVTTLKQLNLLPLPDDHADRLSPEGGEENHKIRHIPCVKFITTSMVQRLVESRD